MKHQTHPPHSIYENEKFNNEIRSFWIKGIRVRRDYKVADVKVWMAWNILIACRYKHLHQLFISFFLLLSTRTCIMLLKEL